MIYCFKKSFAQQEALAEAIEVEILEGLYQLPFC